MPDFGDMIKGVRQGECWSRYGWSMFTYVDLLNADPNDPYEMTAPYLRLCREGSGTTPYTPTHADLLADDWIRVEL